MQDVLHVFRSWHGGSGGDGGEDGIEDGCDSGNVTTIGDDGGGEGGGGGDGGLGGGEGVGGGGLGGGSGGGAGDGSGGKGGSTPTVRNIGSHWGGQAMPTTGSCVFELRGKNASGLGSIGLGGPQPSAPVQAAAPNLQIYWSEEGGAAARCHPLRCPNAKDCVRPVPTTAATPNRTRAWMFTARCHACWLIIIGGSQ